MPLPGEDDAQAGFRKKIRHHSRDAGASLVHQRFNRDAVCKCRLFRGAHSRVDYPNFDDAWGKQNNIIVKRGEEMALEQRPVSEMPADLKEILAENK